MCPGGEVVAAASEEGGIVTNGMSRYARAGKNANSAVLVNVDPADFGSSDVLAGVQLQREIEQAAFRVSAEHGGKPYEAPSQARGKFSGQLCSGEGRKACANVCPRRDRSAHCRVFSFFRVGIADAGVASAGPKAEGL